MGERKIKTSSLVTIIIVISATVTILALVVFVLSGGLKKISDYKDDTNFSEKADEFFDDVDVVTDEIIGTEASVQVVSNGSIENIVAISELQTLTYVYNDIYTMYYDDSEEVRMYVYYEGTVTLGIDTEDISFDYGDDNNRVITVMIPSVQVLSTYIDAGAFEYIEDPSDKDEGKADGVLELCQADIAEKVLTDTAMIELAEESTMAEVKALTEPLVEQFYPDYTIEYVWEEG